MSFAAARSLGDVFNVNDIPDIPAGATHGRFVHPTKGNLILRLSIRESDVMHRNDYGGDLYRYIDKLEQGVKDAYSLTAIIRGKRS